MEPTDGNIAWAINQLQAISHLPGGPTLEAGINATAKAFLRILGDQPESVYYEEPPMDSEGEILQRGVPVRVPGTPAKETGEWLIQQVIDSCDRFPPAIKMREIYCDRGWRCGDGDDVWAKVKAFTKA